MTDTTRRPSAAEAAVLAGTISRDDALHGPLRETADRIGILHPALWRWRQRQKDYVPGRVRVNVGGNHVRGIAERRRNGDATPGPETAADEMPHVEASWNADGTGVPSPVLPGTSQHRTAGSGAFRARLVSAGPVLLAA